MNTNEKYLNMEPRSSAAFDPRMITESFIDPMRLQAAAIGAIPPENKSASTSTQKRHGLNGGWNFDLVKDCYTHYSTNESGGYVSFSKRYLSGTISSFEPTHIKAKPDTTEAERIAKGRKVWNHAEPWQHGPVETYNESRGIYVLNLWDLAFASALMMRIDGKFREVPAMVAKITDALSGEFLGVHRTALSIDGSRVTKLKDSSGKSVKMMLGKAKGGVVKLDDRNPANKTLTVAEGLESAFSVIQLGFPRTWATLSAGGMASLPVVPNVERLDIFADNDDAGQRAAESLASRYAGAGIPVFIHQAENQGQDANDVLKGGVK